MDWEGIVVVGGGAAGLSATVYGASEGLTPLLIEKSKLGGQAGDSTSIENYLGFPKGISGRSLMARAVEQARAFGAALMRDEIVGIEHAEGRTVLTLANGMTVEPKATIIACGARYHRLEAEGIEALTGKGVYYGSAMGRRHSGAAAVVGGGNGAGQAAVYLSHHAEKVYLIVRGEGIEDSMSSYLVERIKAADNITLIPYTSVHRVLPDRTGRLGAIELTGSGMSGDYPPHPSLQVTTLYPYIGAEPCTDWLNGLAEVDEHGFLVTGSDVKAGPRLPHETSLRGVFACGDVRSGSVKRVAAAVGEGGSAIASIHRYVSEVVNG